MTMRTPPTQWCQQFLPQIDPSAFDLDFTARYNIAPTQSVTCVLPAATTTSDGNGWSVEMIRWGLVPPWADELGIGSRMINARCETVAEKPSFRKAFTHQRCLVVVDGYYEWKKTDAGKQPYLIESVGPPGTVIAMAGLWETNTKASPDGTPIRTCTIITTTANDQTADVHDRMPVMLDQKDYQAWLDPAFTNSHALQSMLVPADSDQLRMMPVTRFVNNARNEGLQCVEPMG
ncbi:SOS response-associated peptidase [Rubripirellula tenax]|nr:SOS response-associated peptidase [Rubripirellula tenax]